MQGATWARWYPYVCWQYLSFPILDVTAGDMCGHICCLRQMGSYRPTPDWPADICLNISYISSISQVSSTPVPSHGLSQDTATGWSYPHKILSPWNWKLFTEQSQSFLLTISALLGWSKLDCFSSICVVPSLTYVQNRTSLPHSSGYSNCFSAVQSSNFSSHDQSNQGYHRIFWLLV